MVRGTTWHQGRRDGTPSQWALPANMGGQPGHRGAPCKRGGPAGAQGRSLHMWEASPNTQPLQREGPAQPQQPGAEGSQDTAPALQRLVGRTSPLGQGPTIKTEQDGDIEAKWREGKDKIGERKQSKETSEIMLLYF